MEQTAKKSLILNSIKAGVFSLVFAAIGVLILALIAKLCNLSDSVLPIVNQVLKVVAVALGTAIGVKDEKFLLKAVIGAAIYWVLSFVTFSLLGGQFHWGQIGLDLALSLATAVLVALVKGRRA